MLIYAFMVLRMHNNAYLMYICTYTHIITHITHINNYKHIFYMKIPHTFGHIILIICIQEHSMDTRVDFLQMVQLQVTHTPFEFVGVLSPKVDPHTL